jgi:uncharacterized tellurite resistance protein B-like protein
MIKSVINFFTRNKELDWSQAEREACLKLLILIMYSDGRISEEENKLIRENICSFEWEGVNHEDYFVNETITKVRDLRQDRDIEHYVEKCISALGGDDVKSKIVHLCSELVKADGEQHKQEIKIIALIQDKLL